MIHERHHITLKSKNSKTGPMTIVRTDTRTCPPSCQLLIDGDCYDIHGRGGRNRRRHDSRKYKYVGVGKLFDLMKEFSRIWRLNEGGDLWGEGDRIDGAKLVGFTEAVDRHGKVAIVYTHKPVSGVHERGGATDRLINRKALREALRGYSGTINVSCDSMAEVDRAMDRGYDATVVVPQDTGKGVTMTPGGHRVVTCPATYGPVQCVSCGSGRPLCARKNRGYAVGFPAHGAAKKRLTLRIIREEGE